MLSPRVDGGLKSASDIIYAAILGAEGLLLLLHWVVLWQDNVI